MDVNTHLNSFTIQQILRQAKIESICSRQNKCSRKFKFVQERVENIVGKEESACYQHPAFSPFSIMFSKGPCKSVV